MGLKKIIGVGTIVVLLIIAIASIAMTSVAAGTKYDTIERGEEKGWMIDPGNSQNPSLVAYYYPDGKGTATIKWKQPFRIWIFMNCPTVMVNVYWSSGSPGSTWQYLYSDSISISQRGVPVYLNTGVYKVVVVCYSQKGAGVTLGVA